MEKPTSQYKQVGEALHNARLELGWSQSQMGAIVHVSQATVHRWEKGLAAPDVVQAVEIERLTGKNLRVF